jgi:hypothetical protein
MISSVAIQMQPIELESDSQIGLLSGFGDKMFVWHGWLDR